MNKIDQIVEDILHHFTLPDNTIMPSGQTVRDRIKSYVYEMIDSIEDELEDN